MYTVGDVSMTDTGFGLDHGATTTTSSTTYTRYYSWDEENRLVRSVDNNITVQYSYGADGQRAVKYSKRGESLYFDSMWSCQTDIPSMRQMKNIFVGQTRIATRLSLQGDGSTGYERINTYYYHPDHLGSAQLVTDYQGEEYERIEYTPYGETWIEKTSDGLDLIPFRFTGKELDSETGLYYYGARYLNPRSSMWLSADPALGDYIPVAPVSDEERKHNQNLAGMGGVFNLINLAVHHYAANNPVKYTDPDGEIIWIPIALIAAVCITLIAKDTVPPAATVDFSSLMTKFGECHYGRPDSKMFSSSTSTSVMTPSSIHIASNLISAIGGSLPAGSPQPSDYSDGFDSVRGAVMGGIGLAGTIIGNLADGNGHLSGDIDMYLWKKDGNIVGWQINETITRKDGEGSTTKMTYTYTRQQAIDFLNANKDYLIKAGLYDDMANALGL